MSQEFTIEEIKEGCADLWGNVECLTCSRLLVYIQSLLEMQEWQPLSSAPKDNTVILRPHSVWGTKAVRYKQCEISGVPFEWLSSDYRTAWPEGAFLPFWKPLPEPPKQ